MVSLDMGRKKLTRSCETLSDWIGTLGVGNLALRHGSGDANRAEETDREEKNSCRFHFSSNLMKMSASRSMMTAKSPGAHITPRPLDNAGWAQSKVPWDICGLKGCDVL
jgi:hypothetical protein